MGGAGVALLCRRESALKTLFQTSPETAHDLTEGDDDVLRTASARVSGAGAREQPGQRARLRQPAARRPGRARARAEAALLRHTEQPPEQRRGRRGREARTFAPLAAGALPVPTWRWIALRRRFIVVCGAIG